MMRFIMTRIMRKRKQKLRNLAALLVVALVLGCWVEAANCNEPYERSHYLFDKIDQLNAAGIYSDNEVSCVLVDLSQISTTGSVTSYTYENTVNPVVNNFTSRTMTLTEATSNMTRYILGDIRTAYIEPPFNCSIALSVYGRTSIPAYVYGDGKADCIDEIEQALPNIFAINYVSGGSGRSRVPDKPITLPVAAKALSATFLINSTTYTVNGITQTMDVAPEIKDNRTFVPVRFLAYSLGVAEDNIKWDETTQTVAIIRDDDILTLTIGSNIITVNGEPKVMDTAPYIKSDRTMLPARWIAEPLGASVTWDEITQQAIIEIPQQAQEQAQ